MKKLTVYALLLNLLFSLITPTLAAAQGTSKPSSNGNNAAAGSYIIKFKDAEKGKQSLKKNKRTKRSVPFFSNGDEEKTPKNYKHLTSLVMTDLSASEVDVLKHDSNVAYIEKDSVVKKAGDTVTRNVYQIHVPEVHDQGIYGDGVKVAILDTGINTHSTELHVSGGVSFVSNDASLDDTNGHGTFVAGILAALKDDHGLVGVAPNVSLYDVKVLDANGEGTYSQVIQGIDWAIDNHVDIVAMSFAGNDYSAALEEATQLAYSNGILLVAATGNEGANTVSYPAKLPSVMAVGAVDSNNQLASFSNTGAEVELVAPGVNIEGLPLTGSSYIKMSGTSMAVPQVAGVAALIKEKYSLYTNQDIRRVLDDSSVPLGDETKYGHGLINAQRALNTPLDKQGMDSDKSKANNIVTQKNGTSDIESLIRIFGVTKEFIEQELKKGYPLKEISSALAREKKTKKAYSENIKYIHFQPVNHSQDVTSKVKSDLPKGDFSKYQMLNRQVVSAADTTPPGTKEADLVALNDINLKPDSAPFSISSTNEQISTISGGLTTHTTDLTLPGRNGLSFSLTRIYDSNSSQFNGMDVSTTPVSNPQYAYYVRYVETTTNYVQRYDLLENWENVYYLIDCSTGSASGPYSRGSYSKNGGEYISNSAANAAAAGITTPINVSLGHGCSRGAVVEEMNQTELVSKSITPVSLQGSTGNVSAITSLYYDYSSAVSELNSINSSAGQLISTTGWSGNDFNGYYKTDTNISQYPNAYIVSVQVGAQNYNLYNNATIQAYDESMYPIGKGWNWNISSIESKDGKRYLHLADKGSYQINGSTLVGYPWQDLTITADTSINVNGEQSATVLKSIQGISQYFNGEGRLIQISDVYGNQIQFQYTQDATYGKVLHSITDAIKNTITISYSTTQVVLTQGNKTVTYNKLTQNGKEVLSSVKDALGRKTTYDYWVAPAQFNLLASSSYSASNPYVLLTGITYPTGAKAVYTYETSPVTRYLGTNGYNQAYRIQSREDQMFYTNGTVTTTDKRNHKDFTYNNSDMESSYGLDTTFVVTVKDGLTTTNYNTKKHFIDNNTPQVFTTSSVVQSDASLQYTTTYTYEQGYPNPNSVTTQYQQTLNGTTSTSQAIKISKNYDVYGNVTSETNPLGTTTVTTHHYTAVSPPILSDIIVTEQLNANQTRYTKYSANSLGKINDIITKETDQNGTIIQHKSYTFDAYGNIATTTIHDDNSKQYVITDTYDSSQVNYSGFLTKREVNVTDLDGNSSKLTQVADYYTDSGKVKSYTDANGFTTSFVYDNLNRIKTEKFQDGSLKQWSYDDANNSMAYTDETGIVSSSNWNQLGWKTSEGITGDGIISYDYDPYGRTTTIQDVSKHITTLTYDNWGREIQHQYPDGFSSSIQYDDIHNQKISIDGEKNQIRETYDALGRVTSKELQKKGTNTYSKLSDYTYDYAGDILKSTDSNNNTTTSTYDILGRLKTVMEPSPLSNLTQYTYSLGGNLTQIQYTDGNILRRQYDELGRLIQKTDPAGQVDKYYYDVVNHTTKHIDHNGVMTQQINDNRNRLWKSITPQETITYTYDSAGRRKTMQDGTSTTPTSYEYNSTTGQLKTVTYPDGKQISYQYDGTLGNVQTITDPFGAVSAYGYDAENRLAGVGPALNNWDESYANPNSYNKDNLLASAVQRNGVTTTYGYDWVRANSVTQTKTGGAVINNFGYDYDLNNNVTNKTENGVSYNYTYDQDNRISTSTQFNEQYTYDTRGNRQTLQTNNQPSFNGASYTYDDRNRLTSVTLDNGSTVSYQYNGDGLLYQRTENGQTTRYYYNGTQLIAEGAVSGSNVTQKASYIRGHGLVARVDASGNKTYYLKNGHGDIVGLTDASGNTLNSYTYDMWGNPLTTSEQVQQPFRYSGEFYDNTTGLQYLKSRWYDPSLGRFINQDTYEGDSSNPLSLNLYTYVENNPLRYQDSTGHSPWDAQNYLYGIMFEGLSDLIRRAMPVIPVMEAVTGYDGFTKNQLTTSQRLDSVGKAFTYTAGFVASAAVPTYGGTISSVDDALAGLNASVDRIKDLAEGAGRTGSLELDLQWFGRGANNLKPDYLNATGAHSVWKRDLTTGKVTNYETYYSQTNPMNPNPFMFGKRYDGIGEAHFNKVTNQDINTPHVNDPLAPGRVRAAEPWEIP